jgi:hypothetical protein
MLKDPAWLVGGTPKKASRARSQEKTDCEKLKLPSARPPIAKNSQLPLATPSRGRNVKSQFEMTHNMQMEELAKETVVIVHGTWAAPQPDKTQWYQQPDSAAATEGFVGKLDAALQERGSVARCWAHCTEGNPMFQWSGENSWIARTRAAGALADYLAKLRGEGWRCHIVAHSHGGNIVVEALPQIIAAPSPNKSLGVIVTLGSPFMDTMSPALKRAALARRILDFASWIVILIVVPGAIAGYAYVSEGFWRYGAMFEALAFFSGGVVWFFQTRRIGDLHGAAQDQPPFFAMGSLMDEAWQILHHTETMPNPLAVKSNLLRYLFAALRSGVSRAAQRDLIYGAKSYRDLEFRAKLALATMHVCAIFFILVIIVIVAFMGWGVGSETLSEDIYLVSRQFLYFSLAVISGVLICTKALGESFYSAFLSPFRWCIRRAGSLGLIFPEIGTYLVRKRGWSVLQAITMGLEGYRFKLPVIEQFPRNLPDKIVKYENMPSGAEQRAMERRGAWVSRHIGDVSLTFSRLVVTAADITSLLCTIEDDQTLVHAAYYTDDECIARIADWIAGKG